MGYENLSREIIILCNLRDNPDVIYSNFQGENRKIMKQSTFSLFPNKKEIRVKHINKDISKFEFGWESLNGLGACFKIQCLFIFVPFFF